MAKSNTKQKASFKREFIKQGQKGKVIQHRYENGKLVEVKTIGTHNINVAAAKRLLIGKKEMVKNPIHYGGADNQYETIKVIRAWGE